MASAQIISPKVAKGVVRREIVGRVEAVAEKEQGLFEVRISLAAETVGSDPAKIGDEEKLGRMKRRGNRECQL